MRNIFRIITWLLFIWVIGGSFVLMYMQNIDGVLVDKPATFNVDIQNFKTDKEVYHRGDTVKIYTDYCRNRSFEARTTWRIINATQITFPEKVTQNTAGCTKNWIAIGDVPFYAVSGVHHLEAVSALKISPIKTIYINFRSQDFNVQ